MLAVRPSEMTKNVVQELAKDIVLRWSMVTDKPQKSSWVVFCAEHREATRLEFRVTT